MTTQTPQPTTIELGTAEAHRRTCIRFDELVAMVAPDQWDLPTPCAEWTVRQLVNHVTGEDLWTVPLVAGRTIDEVGSAYDGDVLGDHPIAAHHDAADAARAAVAEVADADRVVHLSFGDAPLGEYLAQLTADHLIHGWDLAQAIGVDDRMDADLVAACGSWFDTVEAMYRDAGVIGQRPAVDPDTDAQTTLLARFGRSRALAAVGRFNAAFARCDADAVMAHMTDDCVFDTTAPAPDGRRYEGRDAVRDVWRELFADAPDARFDTEEIFAAHDRVVVRWTFDWGDGHVRGVDLMRVRDGKVAEKLSYVKG
jgi:uncharacterized protein (TIGR03086 family)